MMKRWYTLFLFLMFFFGCIRSANAQINPNQIHWPTCTSAQAYGPNGNQCLNVNANTGVAANSSFVFVGDSANDDDTNTIEPAIPLSAFTCASGTCTVTNTGTNNLVAGDWVNMRFSTAWTSTFSAPTDIALSTGYTLFKVLSSGLSSTQFEFSYSGSGTCSSTCGNAAKATYNLPFNTTNYGILAGIGTTQVVVPSPVSLQALNTYYSTILHPLSEAVTGNPTYFIIGNEEDDVGSTSVGCNSAATIEASLQSLWAKIHTDGSTVVEWSSNAITFNQGGLGGCTDAYQIMFELEQWLPMQAKSATNYASGEYWDEFADVGRIVNDPTNSLLIASNGGFGQGGVNLAAADIARVISTGISDTLDKRPQYYGAGPSVSSAGNGFVHVPAADAIYYESWWDAAMSNQVFAIGTATGYKRFQANTAATNSITDTIGMTFAGPILSVTEGYGSSSAYVNDYPMTTFFTPNQGASGTPFWQWGYANSTNNAITMQFNYSSSGSTSNFVTIALQGTNGIKIDGAGNFYIPGIGSSTNPLCTTTGGEVTNSGCAGSSPLTTKGDVYVYGSSNTRLPVGSDGQVLTADSTQTLGVKWDTPSSLTAIPTCGDTSGSGTAQSCTTSPTFTPAAGSVIIYTTTTSNSGTGLTVNVNSLGAKSVAKWQTTTTLAAGDIKANTQILMTYDGTNWEASTIGNAPSGGGGGSGAWTNLTSTVTPSGCTVSNGACAVSGSTTTAVTFSSIPGTYNALQIRVWGQASSGVGLSAPYGLLTFNGDSTSGHYFLNGSYQNGSGSPAPNVVSSAPGCYTGQIAAGGASQLITDILFYASTAFPKVGSSRSSAAVGTTLSSNVDETLTCGYTQTTAITSITDTITAGDFVAGTEFEILGQN